MHSSCIYIFITTILLYRHLISKEYCGEMVVPCSTPAVIATPRKNNTDGIPTIDLSSDRAKVSKSIVQACEQLGFFKVTNHGVDKTVSDRLENEGLKFFSKPLEEKMLAGPASPFGYGRKNIGAFGDIGELEYLLLQANRCSVFDSSKAISDDPLSLCDTLNEYVAAVRELACKILELAGEGLRLPNKHVISDFIRHDQSDSMLRFNYYPTPVEWDPPSYRIGFGEHSDPQILTVLRSNDVPGLEICQPGGSWVAVPPDPSAYYIIIGDTLEALTNGRFIGVRHRAIVISTRARMSTMYFCAPPLDGLICPMPELVSSSRPVGYTSFTWGEYKRAVYSKQLGHNRIDLFKINSAL